MWRPGGAGVPSEGVVVETRGALIQGIFGVGGERQESSRPSPPRRTSR